MNGDFNAVVPLHMATQWRTPQSVRHLPLEFLHLRTIIGQPLSFQHTADTLQQALGIRHIRPANVNEFAE